MEYRVSLIDRVQDGDVQAFEQIFAEYHLRLCRYLCSLVHDADLAQDLAQQTFVKAYKALAGGDCPQNLNAWLYAIATNTALSALRRRKLLTWLPLHHTPLASKTGGREQEARLCTQELLQQALRRLAPQETACLLLRFQQGLSYGELAQVLNVSVPAAKMRLSRARAAFREIYLELTQEANR